MFYFLSQLATRPRFFMITSWAERSHRFEHPKTYKRQGSRELKQQLDRHPERFRLGLKSASGKSEGQILACGESLYVPYQGCTRLESFDVLLQPTDTPLDTAGNHSIVRRIQRTINPHMYTDFCSSSLVPKTLASPSFDPYLRATYGTLAPSTMSSMIFLQRSSSFTPLAAHRHKQVLSVGV